LRGSKNIRPSTGRYADVIDIIHPPNPATGSKPFKTTLAIPALRCNAARRWRFFASGCWQIRRRNSTKGKCKASMPFFGSREPRVDNSQGKTTQPLSPDRVPRHLICSGLQIRFLQKQSRLARCAAAWHYRFLIHAEHRAPGFCPLRPAGWSGLASASNRRCLPAVNGGLLKCAGAWMHFRQLRFIQLNTSARSNQFRRPRADAAFDALDVFKALLLQKVHRLQRPARRPAVQVNRLVRDQLGEAVRADRSTQQRHALDFCDSYSSGSRTSTDPDAEDRIVERLFHVLDGDFIRIGLRRCRLRHNAAELLVIINCLMVGCSPQTGHAGRGGVSTRGISGLAREQEAIVDERTGPADGEFQNFRGLDAADDAGNTPSTPPSAAARHHAGRRRFGIKTAVTRPARCGANTLACPSKRKIEP